MRKKTLARFEEWRLDPNVPGMIFSRVAEGETLQEVCAEQGIPYSLVAGWISGTPGLKQQYDLALTLRADVLAQEALKIADEQGEVEKKDGSTFDPDVPRDKLRVETRLKLAGKWDRARYGEREPAGVVVNVSLGDVAREIAQLEERLGMRAALPAAVVQATDAEII